MRKTHSLSLVAGALLATPHARHYGYELSRLTGVRSGVMYPILDRLLEAGWVADQDEDDEDHVGPPRHYYLLTNEGRDHLPAYADAS